MGAATPGTFPPAGAPPGPLPPGVRPPRPAHPEVLHGLLEAVQRTRLRCPCLTRTTHTEEHAAPAAGGHSGWSLRFPGDGFGAGERIRDFPDGSPRPCV